MLDLLVDGFNERICLAEDSKRIRSRLQEEKSRLMDPGYLQGEVIGEPRWAWDFESLDAGFMDLVGPFMAREAGTSHLYLQALREFGGGRPEHENVIVLLEYSHYASMIEDYYNLNETFAESTLDPRRCSLLTQVKFAGQYMLLYPRHLLIRNALKADERTLIRVHRWLKNTYITRGISGGIMLKWLDARFNGVQEDHYLQNSINGLCTYFISPIVMAAIMAGTSEETVGQLKEALSWFTLSVKLRCERRTLMGQLGLDLGPYHEKALLSATLPGTLFLQKGLRLGQDVAATMTAVHGEMMKQVQEGLTEMDLSRLAEQERGYFTRFMDQMKQIKCTPELVHRLADCLTQEVSS